MMEDGEEAKSNLAHEFNIDKINSVLRGLISTDMEIMKQKGSPLVYRRFHSTTRALSRNCVYAIVQTWVALWKSHIFFSLL